MRAYLDACAVIYYVERVRPWSSAVAAAMRELGSAGQLLISDLVRLECAIGPLRSSQAEWRLSLFDHFNTTTTILPLTPAVFDRAARIRAQHGLKTPDALHVACALEHGCDEFWTNDQRFRSAAPDLELRVFA